MSFKVSCEPQTNNPLHLSYSDDNSHKTYNNSTYTSYESMVEDYMDIKEERGFNQLPNNYDRLWEINKNLSINIYHKIENILDKVDEADINSLKIYEHKYSKSA